MILERIAMYFRRPHHNCEAQYPLFSSNFSHPGPVFIYALFLHRSSVCPRFYSWCLSCCASVKTRQQPCLVLTTSPQSRWKEDNKEADTRIIYQLRDEIFTSYYINLNCCISICYIDLQDRNVMWDIFLNGTYEGFWTHAELMDL